MRYSRKKSFEYKEGAYYFNIKTGYNSSITIKRLKKDQAIQTFANYLKARKECEWLGKWNGKEFVEANYEKLAAA